MDQPSSESQPESTFENIGNHQPPARTLGSVQDVSHPTGQPAGKRWFTRTEVIVISLGCLLLSGLAVVMVILAFVLVPRLGKLNIQAPKTAQYYLDRGWELYNQGKLDEAITQYTQALQLDAQNEEAYLKRGIAYLDKNFLVVAIDDFTKAIELAPDHASGYYDRGIAYYYKSDAPHALEDFNKAIELQPDHADAYVYRGMVNGWMGKMDQSMSDLNQALQLDPDNGYGYYYRAMTYLDRDDTASARADLQKSLELCGDDKDLCNSAHTQLDQLEDGQ